MRVDAVASAASGVEKSQPLHGDPQRLKEDLIRREVHLIAAHLNTPGRCLRQRFWNSIALGHGLICTGFAGEMVTSWKRAQPRAIRSASESVEAITLKKAEVDLEF
jgi:hypothetical protein